MASTRIIFIVGVQSILFCCTTAFNPLANPIFTEPISNITVAVGRDTNFACSVSDLDAYKVAWVRVDTQTILTIDKHVITRNSRISVEHYEDTWYLHIRRVRQSDAGQYMCQINTNPMIGQYGFLYVVVPPDILDQQTNSNIIAREGFNVSLFCAAKGTPQPSITWRREDGELLRLLKGVDAYTAEGSTLQIANVKREHTGFFLCIASNGVPPSKSKRVMLTVEFPPAIWIANSLQGIYEGSQAILECYVESHPTAVTYWIEENSNSLIFQSHKYDVTVRATNHYKIYLKLVINNVTASDLGRYSCIARNSLGESDGTIIIYRLTKNITSGEAIQVSSEKDDSDQFSFVNDQRSNRAQSYNTDQLLLTVTFTFISLYILVSNIS